MAESIWFWLAMMLAGVVGVLVWCYVLHGTLGLLRKREWL